MHKIFIISSVCAYVLQRLTTCNCNIAPSGVALPPVFRYQLERSPGPRVKAIGVHACLESLELLTFVGQRRTENPWSVPWSARFVIAARTRNPLKRKVLAHSGLPFCGLAKRRQPQSLCG